MVHIKKFLAIVFLLPYLAACGSEPSKNMPTPTPIPATPMSASPEKIEKPTNVSFSTYSKDWPVGWLWIDPDEKQNPTPHDVNSRTLKMRVPSKKDLYGDNRTAPRYLKAISGDFQIETRVKFLPKANYQGAGLLIFYNDDNYMRFERAYGGVGGGAEGLRIDVRKGADNYVPIVTPNDIETDAGQVDLLIIRQGQKFTAYWRLDEESEWREAGEFESDYPETILAGLVACNTASEITAEFAYIKLLPAAVK